RSLHDALPISLVWVSVTSDVLLCGSSVHTAQVGHAVRRWHPRHAPARAAQGREVRPCPLQVSSSAARPVHEAAYHRVRRTRYHRQGFGLEGGGHGAGPTGRRFPGSLPVLEVTAVVPSYRCGTVPDSHRVPSHAPCPERFDEAPARRGGHRRSRTDCTAVSITR